MTVDSVVQDFRYAIRMLTKAPAFTAVAVLTLALGIGANTVVFGMVNSVLLRPLPFDRPEQLVKIWGQYSKQDIPQNWISEPEVWDLRDRLQSVSAIAAYNTGTGANFTRDASEPLRITINQASAELLPMLGVKPALGRLFNADEDQPGRERVALLDFGFWKAQMGADASIVGRNIQLNGQTYTVIGVLPEGFTFGGDANVWLPLALDRAKPNNRGNHYLEVLARLKPGVTLPQASADLDTITRDLSAQFNQFYPKDSGFGFYLRLLQTDLVGSAKLGLVVLFAAVGFVLLIACINLANLLLARGSSRSRELAVRTALGAGRLRIVRQMVTESIVIALAGGACGVLLALWLTEALRSTAAVALPNTRPLTVDVQVLLFAAAASIATGVLFGLVPALQSSSQRGISALKDAARGSSGVAGRALRGALVVAEISMALVLLVIAGLMVRSLQQLLEVNPGFQAERLLTARISLPQSNYRDINATTAFFATLQDRVRTLPAVQSAGLTTLLPMTGRNSSGSTFIDQTAAQGLTESQVFQKPYLEADQRTVTPGFFEAMRIPVLRGRSLTGADTPDAPPAIVVDEEFAKRLWPDREPIGQRIAVGIIPNSNPPVLRWSTVVGIVGHVKNNALDQVGREQIYVPLAQTPFPIRNMYLTVRASGDPAAMTSAIQNSVHALDASLPVYEVKTMDAWLDTTVSPRRFNVALLLAFGALALTLAAIGTYGVIAYSVSQRTQEIGIRMALGASRQDVLRLVIGGGLRLAAAGVLIGVALSLAAGRLISTLLFGVRASDPLTFSAVAAMLLGTAFFAAWIPARRATRVDPMVALRYE
jgi:putative ABC transport system permease protein